ncbi:MAG TPA: hypothetical protein VLS49_01975, partial [Usitatibacter sp.]|nr:hypothetical protein [Usitatibacter sp.]
MQQIAKGVVGFTRLMVLAAIGAFIAWRIVVVNMADLFAEGGDADGAAAALKWDNTHAGALYTHA